MALHWQTITGSPTIKAVAAERTFFIHPVSGLFELTGLPSRTSEVVNMGTFISVSLAKAHAEASLANMRRFMAQARGGA